MYLMRLADRVSRGLAKVPNFPLESHRRFLLCQQAASGGFHGRDGDGDLYYTGFAVRALAVTGGLPEEPARLLSGFLRDQNPLSLSAVDLLSWLYSAIVVESVIGGSVLTGRSENFAADVVSGLQQLRTADGGFSRTSEGAVGSTYQSFMCALVHELLGQRIPRRNALVQFLYDRQREDGGFVEIAPMKRSGTNPTAAATALLTSLDAMDDDIAADVLGFLTDVVSSEGGFQANTRVPFADGLSTFTGLLTAQDLGRRDLLPAEQVLSYVRGALELESGGFRGASWDQQADVEYTFYGLGILGLLYS
ncbi:MAG TPA: geranyl transferase [Planctomycetaceae bacterium]|mgnify:FL=1|nr:geranyl transferase [Planctomycetaceae bacterium]